MDDRSQSKVDQFIIEQIDSVPHLEALLLLWNTRPKEWAIDDMARALYVSSNMASKVLEGLVSRELISYDENKGLFTYRSGSEERDTLLESVDITYKRELVRVAGMIHSKASVAVRDFARAFRFKKD